MKQTDIPPDLHQSAIYAFGGAAEAEKWFHRPQPFVVYLRPIDAIKTPAGKRMIRGHIKNQIRLNEGILS